jgi:hypothetical protein
MAEFYSAIDTLPRLRGNMEIRSRDEPDMSSKGEAPVTP